VILLITGRRTGKLSSADFSDDLRGIHYALSGANSLQCRCANFAITVFRQVWKNPDDLLPADLAAKSYNQRG
jgi:hypothetical protein